MAELTCLALGKQGDGRAKRRRTRAAGFALMAMLAIALGACDDAESGAASDAGAPDGAIALLTDASIPLAAPLKIELITGVPECDEMIARYALCLDKNPALKLKEGLMFEARRTSLKMQAGTPDGKATIPTRCKALFATRLQTNCR